MAIQFLSSATSTFLNLQSGNASPFFYIEAIISGTTSIIGTSFTSTNWLIDGGTIDREKPALPGDRSNIFSSDVTLKIDNSTKRFSPKESTSVFFNNDYLDSPINYYAGFINISGTAMLVQRGSFFLDTIRIDSRQNIAYFHLRDKFRKALDVQIGGNDPSGTAIQFVATGILPGNLVLQSLLLTGAGLTSTDLNLQTASISFNNISFSTQSVAQAASLISEASDGYLYTSRKGLLTFNSNAPAFGSGTATFSINNSGHFQNIFFEETKGDRLNKVTVEFGSGTSIAVVDELTGNTSSSIIISNDSIQGTAEAQSIASRTRDRFSGQASKVEIISIWLPSLDIDDRLSITDNNLSLSANVFRIYKIQEEPTNGTMTIFAISERGNRSNEDNKFGFISDPSAANPSGGIFTGGAGELNGWQAGWAFVARDNTAINPYFDQDGDNNNVLNTGVTSSGAGGTGIEVPFVCY